MVLVFLLLYLTINAFDIYLWQLFIRGKPEQVAAIRRKPRLESSLKYVINSDEFLHGITTSFSDNISEENLVSVPSNQGVPNCNMTRQIQLSNIHNLSMSSYPQYEIMHNRVSHSSSPLIFGSQLSVPCDIHIALPPSLSMSSHRAMALTSFFQGIPLSNESITNLVYSNTHNIVLERNKTRINSGGNN